MKKIVISGLSLCNCNHITGIERMCRELILRLDKLIKNTDFEIEYAVLEGAPNRIISPNELKNIKVVTFKPHKIWGKLVTLPRYIKQQHAIGVCFDHSFLRSKNYLATLHDIRPLCKNNSELIKIRLLFNFLLIPIVKRYSKVIVTDSEYQKKLINNRLKCVSNKIQVIGCGWEHIRDIGADHEIFNKYPQLQLRNYYYTIGSIAPHKNFRWVSEIAKRHPEQTFVIAGNLNSNGEIQTLPNIIYTGYVSDRESKALMTNCKAFLFPSKFEGFGIPPLEALACGVPICISNATCLPEIYGECAHYFDPDDYDVNLDKLLQQPVKEPQELLQKYTWENATQAYFELFKTLLKSEDNI